MKLMKKASETSKPRKRAFGDDHSSGCDAEESRNPKRRVQVVRDFPPGCGSQETGRKTLKMSVENNQLSKVRPVEFERIKRETGSRTMHTVKSQDPNCSKNVGTQMQKVAPNVVTQEKALKRLGNINRDIGNKGKAANSKDYDEQKRIEPAEFKKYKTSYGSKPRRQTKLWDPRDDKQPKVTTKITVSPRKPLKNVDTVDSKIRKVTSNGEDNKPSRGSEAVSTGGLRKKLTTKSTVSPGKPVKNLDNVESNNRRLTSNGEDNQYYFGSEVASTSVSRKEQIARQKIKEVMKVFTKVYTQLSKENELRPMWKERASTIPLEAAKLANQRLRRLEPEKRLGPICGVNVGDTFSFRAQLKMIGLHSQHHVGIDYTNINGKKLAISVVDSCRYKNKMISDNELIYCGHGGLDFSGTELPPKDQKLERGNLALKNSKDEKNPVRVIRKDEDVYVYDGLYTVKDCVEKTEDGKIVFEYHLDRILPDQAGNSEG